MAKNYHSILLLTVVYLISRGIRAMEFTHEVGLDPNGDYEMKWTFDNETITVKLIVKTTGWIGWGLSQSGVMKGADMVIGWVDDHGKKHFTDRHAMGHHVPYIDDRQDYKLLELFEENGYTTMVFRRNIKLCDEHDFLITTDTMRVLYAWNDEDPVQNKHIVRHTKRGSRSVFLLDYAYSAKQELPSTYKTVDFVMTNLTLPDWNTAYWCKGFILPNITGKHHLVRIEHIITPGNEEYVHHMLLYQCKYVSNKSANVQHHCNGRNMPDIECGRDIVVHGWAVGGTTFFYPKDVGFSLNDEGDPKFFLLEVHYDNRETRSDIVDHSGVRLVYTDELRRYDASVLATGVSPDNDGDTQIIPQNQKAFTTFGYCNSACLNITTQKRYIFSANLHTHLYGRKIIVRLVRDSDGVEVKRIAEDLNYDFNFQEGRMLKERVEILPGHSIHVECTYNTEGRPSPVLSGLGTRQEMCLAYLFIYPKLNTRVCYSRSVTYYTWGNEKFNWQLGQRGEIQSSVVVGGKDYKHYPANEPLKQKEFWMKYPNLVKDFEKALEKGPYWKICSSAKNSRRLRSSEFASSKLRKEVAAENCTEDVTSPGEDGNGGGGTGGGDVQMKAMPWVVLLVLCAGYLTR